MLSDSDELMVFSLQESTVRSRRITAPSLLFLIDLFARTAAPARTSETRTSVPVFRDTLVSATNVALRYHKKLFYLNLRFLLWN